MTEPSKMPTTYPQTRAAAPALNVLFARTEMVPASVLRVLLWLLVVVALVDPADQIFHLKVPIFALVVLLWLFRASIQPKLDPRVLAAVLFFALILPATWTVFGLLRAPIPSAAVSFSVLKSFLFLILLPVVVAEDFDLSRVLINVSFVIAILTIALVGIYFLMPVAFELIYKLTLDKQVALVNTSRDQFGIGVGAFYYKTSPVMALALAEFGRRWMFVREHRRRHGFGALLFAVALAFSGARANLLGMLAICGTLLLAKVANRWGKKWSVLVAVITISLAAVLLAGFFDPTESSNYVKIGHYRSYVEEFREHPDYLIIGQGADTSFYSEGFQYVTNVTELSYMELIRQFGIPMGLVILAALLYPVFILLRQRVSPSATWLGVGCVAYYAISASNPLLFSSTGFLVVVAVWQKALAISSPATAEVASV